MRITTLLISLGLWACIFLSACSFKVEFGYHGETGRDDRTQSQLLKNGGK